MLEIDIPEVLSSLVATFMHCDVEHFHPAKSRRHAIG